MTNSDMSQYIGVFLDEAQEQLELFENHIIGLERSENPDAELQILFRTAHTLKGSSKAMGFSAIGDLTHELENVLDALRSHEMSLSSEVVDALLEGMDLLKGLVASIANDGEERGDSDRQLRLIEELTKLRDHQTETTPKINALRTVGPKSSAMQITIRLVDACPMKGIRATIILSNLERFGTVISTSPSIAELQEDQFDNEFVVDLETECTVDGAQAALATMIDVESVEIVDNRAVQVEPVAAPEVVPSAATQNASSTVRVDIARLDKLLNLVGELVTDRTQLITMATSLLTRHSDDDQISELVERIHRIGAVTAELQEEVMKSRMLPINGVFQRMPRMVRDLAQKTGKDLDLEIFGGETELDRSVLEILGDPLIHLLRNAVDHGIEEPQERIASGKPMRGRVTISARHERSQIVIEIEDDGRGIDPASLRKSAIAKGIITESSAETMTDRESIQLIFAPGFTTAKQLSDISGRGVGMDIVRSNIERIGGRIAIESKIGTGSRFQIFLPLTLAIVRAVLVESHGQIYAIPLTFVTEMVTLKHDSHDSTQCSAGGQAALMLRGKSLPLACFADVLDGDVMAVQPDRVSQNSYAVVVRHRDGEAALSVDALLGEMEVVIKPLGSILRDIPGISGASILGDGRVALVVDPSKALEDLNRYRIAA